MKSTIAILLILLSSVASFAGQGMGPGPGFKTYAAAPSGIDTFTDNFTGTDGAALDTAKWDADKPYAGMTTGFDIFSNQARITATSSSTWIEITDEEDLSYPGYWDGPGTSSGVMKAITSRINFTTGRTISFTVLPGLTDVERLEIIMMGESAGLNSDGHPTINTSAVRFETNLARTYYYAADPTENALTTRFTGLSGTYSVTLTITSATTYSLTINGTTVTNIPIGATIGSTFKLGIFAHTPPGLNFVSYLDSLVIN